MIFVNGDLDLESRHLRFSATVMTLAYRCQDFTALVLFGTIPFGAGRFRTKFVILLC